MGVFSELYNPAFYTIERLGCGLTFTAAVNLRNSDGNTLTFFSNKRKRPCEDVHEVGQPVWVGGTVELADVHHIVLILQHCRLGEQYYVHVT